MSLVRDMMIPRTDGKMDKVYDSIGVYYYGDYVLYQLPNQYQESSLRMVDVSPEEGIIIDSVILEETRYNYFAYKKGDATGYLYDSVSVKDWKRILYDSIDSKKWKRKSVDSIKGKRVMEGIDFSSIPRIARLYRTTDGNEPGNKIQMYISPERKEEGFDDSVYLYFSKKAVDLPFSFSRELDSATGSKLYQVRILFNEKYSDRYNRVFPKREYRFAVKEEKIEDKKAIQDFFYRLFARNMSISESLK